MENVQQGKQEFASPGCLCPHDDGVFPKPCPGHGEAVVGPCAGTDAASARRIGAVWTQHPCTRPTKTHPEPGFGEVSPAPFLGSAQGCAEGLNISLRGRRANRDPRKTVGKAAARPVAG